MAGRADRRRSRDLERARHRDGAATMSRRCARGCEQGVTGYPAMLLVMERFGYPDYLQATADELSTASTPTGLTSPHPRCHSASLPQIGEVEIQRARLRRPAHTEANIRCSPTDHEEASRPGAPTDRRPAARGRLEVAKNFGQSSVTHKIGLDSAADSTTRSRTGSDEPTRPTSELRATINWGVRTCWTSASAQRRVRRRSYGAAGYCIERESG